MPCVRKSLTVLIVLFACSNPAGPDDTSRNMYRAVRVENGSLQWEKAAWSQGFVFRGFRGIGNPTPERTDPNEQTTFKVLYDDYYLYFMIRCFDSGPITQTTETGNWWDADWIEVNIDGSLSQSTAASYNITAGGLFRSDWITGNGDDWEELPSQAIGVVSIDSGGWVVNMKIPLSELRTVRYKNQVMGLQVHRYLARGKELTNWQPLHGGFLSEWVRQAGRLLLH